MDRTFRFEFRGEEVRVEEGLVELEDGENRG